LTLLVQRASPTKTKRYGNLLKCRAWDVGVSSEIGGKLERKGEGAKNVVFQNLGSQMLPGLWSASIAS